MAVKLVATGVRRFGFKGRVRRWSRRLETGAIQLVHMGRQQPFRAPSFAVGLSVVPAAVLALQLSRRRDERSRSFAEGLRALGIRDDTPTDQNRAVARAKLSRILGPQLSAAEFT
jgi:hypothetical protein